jgi:hypothetical protein
MTERTLAYLPSPTQSVWHLGPLPIHAYALCIVTGIVVALRVAADGTVALIDEAARCLRARWRDGRDQRQRARSSKATRTRSWTGTSTVIS